MAGKVQRFQPRRRKMTKAETEERQIQCNRSSYDANNRRSVAGCFKRYSYTQRRKRRTKERGPNYIQGYTPCAGQSLNPSTRRQTKSSHLVPRDHLFLETVFLSSNIFKSSLDITPVTSSLSVAKYVRNKKTEFCFHLSKAGRPGAYPPGYLYRLTSPSNEILIPATIPLF